MKAKKLLVSALLALGLALSAHAQVTADLGDLVLGFRKSTTATGSTSNLLVNLGSVNDFKAGGTNATGSEVFLSQLNVADLNALFGTAASGNSGWKSNITQWTVASTLGASGSNQYWMTARTTPPNPTGSQGPVANNIGNVINDLDGSTATANSAVSAVLSQPNAMHTGMGNNFNVSGGALVTALNTALATGGTSSIKLYEVVQGSGAAVELGTFKLYATGDFSFTAIPEPSTYAALLGVVTLGVVAVRRRRQAMQEASI